MKELYPLHGIVTVLNTPFNEDGSVNYSALKKNVQEALHAGVAGFLVPAMASEVLKLSFDEKCKLVDCVIQEVNGQVPVLAGTASTSMEDSKKLLQAFMHLGIQQALIQLPFQNERQFKNEFYELAAIGPDVIMLQDWNASGYGLPDSLILNLFNEVPSFRCLKIETVPAGMKYSNILKLTNEKLNVSGGWAVMQLPEAMRRGVHAFMPTGMHWIYTRIFNDYIQGNTEDAEKLFTEILPVLAFSNQHLDVSIHFFKRLLWKQGIYPTPIVRDPILPFDSWHEETADKLIKKVIELENRLKS